MVCAVGSPCLPAMLWCAHAAVHAAPSSKLSRFALCIHLSPPCSRLHPRPVLPGRRRRGGGGTQEKQEARQGRRCAPVLPLVLHQVPASAARLPLPFILSTHTYIPCCASLQTRTTRHPMGRGVKTSTRVRRRPSFCCSLQGKGNCVLCTGCTGLQAACCSHLALTAPTVPNDGHNYIEIHLVCT